jgi:hypothetical protein
VTVANSSPMFLHTLIPGSGYYVVICILPDSTIETNTEAGI